MRIGYLKRHVCTRKGVDSLGKKKIRLLFDHYVTGGSFLSADTVFLNWWYLYMFTVFLLFIRVMVSLGFVIFPILLMFVIISLMAYANISCVIIDLFWFRLCWWMSCCAIGDWHHNPCDIRAYCMILLISEFLLNTLKIIHAVVPLAYSVSGLYFPRSWSG